MELSNEDIIVKPQSSALVEFAITQYCNEDEEDITDDSKLPHRCRHKDVYINEIENGSFARKTIRNRKNTFEGYVLSYVKYILKFAQRFNYPQLDIQDVLHEGILAFVEYTKGRYHQVRRSELSSLFCRAVPSIVARMCAFCAEQNNLDFDESKMKIRLSEILYKFYINVDCWIDEDFDFIALFSKQICELTDLIDNGISGIEYYEEDLGVEEIYVPDKMLLAESRRIDIEKALALLVSRLSEILRLLCGIGVQEKTLEEIGEELGLTRERVRQMSLKALKRISEGRYKYVLRQYLGDEIYNYSPSEAYEYCKYRIQAQEIIDEQSKGALLIAEKKRQLEEAEALEAAREKARQLREMVKQAKREAKLKFKEEAKVAAKKQRELKRILGPKPQGIGYKKWSKQEEKFIAERYIEGIPYDEIAKQVKRTEGAVKGRLCLLGYLRWDSETKTYYKIK